MVIAVFGAGAIGCWVGGKLAASGANLTLIGRARILDQLTDGLAISDFEGGAARSTPQLATTPSAAAHASLVLVTVKSAQTAEAAAALADVLDPSAVVVSLQIGVRNADVLRAAAASSGARGDGAVQRHEARRDVSSCVGRDPARRRDPANAELLAACARASLMIEARRDMLAVQWAKLVINLNNAIAQLQAAL